MNRHLIYIGAVAALCAATPVQAWRTVLEVRVNNPSKVERKYQPVVLDLAIWSGDQAVRSASVTCGGKVIASQLDDLNGDARPDELAFVTDVPAQGAAVCQVTLSDDEETAHYTHQVRAYLKLHDQKGKHPEVKSITYPGDADLLDMYNSIYGHGAVFESALMAFRVYMDHRQSIDLYGKTTPRLEMDSTGFYTTREQLAQGYGCDVLWAGQSVGCGSFRGLTDGKPCYIDTVAWRRQTVLADGPVRAIVEVADGQWLYHGREVDMTQRYTVYAGHRDVEVDIVLRGIAEGETFCTGVQKLENQSTGFVREDGLCASWGNNIPDKGAPDLDEWVGLGLCAAPFCRENVKEDELNYLTLLKADPKGRIHYSVTACARRENGGFASSSEWFEYLNQWKESLDKPCVVTASEVEE